MSGSALHVKCSACSLHHNIIMNAGLHLAVKAISAARSRLT